MANPDPSQDLVSPGRLSRSRTTTAVQGIPQILRSVEVRLELLRARGVQIPEVDLIGPYARYLVCESLMLKATDSDEAGFDAVDSDDARYRIVATRGGGAPDVIVPGLPHRRFDWIAAVHFGEGYGIVSAGVARSEAFLRRAEYRSETNDWLLPATDDFWTGSDAADLTVALRAAAARAMTEESLPLVDSFLGPMPYPERTPETDLTPRA